ncbi:hypothetical protein [Streptomyces chartreusis]|uniref:hypothetical protein n=1 Tax=Streptomyces chartreusis TaxID=1969 RepID=UPI0036928215
MEDDGESVIGWIQTGPHALTANVLSKCCKDCNSGMAVGDVEDTEKQDSGRPSAGSNG